VLGAGVFIFMSLRTVGLGFPLDDSWIHATYARNLSLYGEWAFRVGTLSAGSTSPLWTILLVPGYWFGLAPLWWSYLLGLCTVIAIGAAAESTARVLCPEYRARIPWVGIFMASEWHLLWAAGSGMETNLQAALCTVVIFMAVTGSRRSALMGLLSGLSVWVRPDGLTLVPVCLGVIAASRRSGRDRLLAALAYLIGIGALVLPYVVLNLSLGGTPFPNTFYAKQAEYAAWQGRPVLERLGLALLQLSTGPAILLWPASVWEIYTAIRTRDVPLILAVSWCLGYVLMYTMRLPAYQHARYFIPAMPVLLVLGLVGLLHFRQAHSPHARNWAVAWAWTAGLALIQIGFVAMGSRAYGQDVALIESEMVTTARWANANLSPAATIAAHDIGALGYFDDHRLIDLAGLVSPDVIPFMRDEERLAAYLDDQDVNYLITFPGLYPGLIERLPRVYVSDGASYTAAGEGSMSVYCWRCP